MRDPIHNSSTLCTSVQRVPQPSFSNSMPPLSQRISELPGRDQQNGNKDSVKNHPSPSGVIFPRIMAPVQLSQLSLNSGSAQVQNLLAACQRFTMVRIPDNGPGWK